MADTFALDLSKFIAKAESHAREVVQKTAIELFAKTVERTPVGNPTLWKSKPPAGYVGGRLRANWNTSFNSPDATVTTSTSYNGKRSEITGKVGQWREGDIYLMNSLPYVHEIEYGNHSTQAPAGMVRVTVTEFQTYVAKAIASLPK